MNDLGILQQIHEELKTVDHPRFTNSMIDFYGLLVSRVPEDGFEQIWDDNVLSIDQESAILQLKKYGYLDSSLRRISLSRIEHNVDLRGKRFFEIAAEQSKATIETEIVETAEDYPPPPWGCQCRKPCLIHDSGKRETFSTGAVRDTAEGKPRFDLFSPFAMERIGFWLMRGAEKYSEHNWTKGIPASRCMASLQRHLMKYMQGATDEDHLSAVATNCMFLLHFEEVCKRGILPESLLDLQKYEPIPAVHQNNDEPLDYEPDEEFRWRTIHGNSQQTTSTTEKFER